MRFEGAPTRPYGAREDAADGLLEVLEEELVWDADDVPAEGLEVAVSLRVVALASLVRCAVDLDGEADLRASESTMWFAMTS